MPRWPATHLAAKTPQRKPKLNLIPPKVAQAAGTRMLQVGDVHIIPSEVVAIESVGGLTCLILTENFRVSAAVSHLAAREAIETLVPLTVWATPTEIGRHHLDARELMVGLEAEYEARQSRDQADADERSPVLR